MTQPNIEGLVDYERKGNIVTLSLNLLLGADFPGFAYLVSPAITALLWAPVTWLLYSSAARRRWERSAV